MKTEYQVMEALRDVLQRDIPGYLEVTTISDESVVIDFPDTDNMRKDSMVFIQPQYEGLEDLSVSSDSAEFDVSVYILCRKDKYAELIRKVFDIYQALYQAVRKNDTLDGFIESARVTDMEYYPSVSPGQTITAIEVSLLLGWAKDF